MEPNIEQVNKALEGTRQMYNECVIFSSMPAMQFPEVEASMKSLTKRYEAFERRINLMVDSAKENGDIDKQKRIFESTMHAFMKTLKTTSGMFQNMFDATAMAYSQSLEESKNQFYGKMADNFVQTVKKNMASKPPRELEGDDKLVEFYQIAKSFMIMDDVEKLDEPTAIYQHTIQKAEQLRAAARGTFIDTMYLDAILDDNKFVKIDKQEGIKVDGDIPPLGMHNFIAKDVNFRHGTYDFPTKE